MQRSVSNDFEILERNSLSSSSISLVQSLDDLTPLPSPVYQQQMSIMMIDIRLI